MGLGLLKKLKCMYGSTEGSETAARTGKEGAYGYVPGVIVLRDDGVDTPRNDKVGPCPRGSQPTNGCVPVSESPMISGAATVTSQLMHLHQRTYRCAHVSKP